MPPLAGWTLWITGFVGKVPALDYVMSILASDFFAIVTICLILLSLWLGHPDRARREQIQKTVMSAAIALGISTLVVFILNFHIFWPRPFQVADPAIRESATYAAQTIFYMPRDPSFPSNAAAVSFAVATSIWFGNRKASVVLFILAFLWSFSRSYAGIHFFVDLVGGAMIGVATAFMSTKVFMPRIEPLPTWAMRLARLLYIA